MNNSTNTTNITDNQSSGYWNPIDLNNIPDIGKIITDVENKIVEMLVSWDLDPFHTIFSLLVVVVLVLALSQGFVQLTSRSSGIFRPIMYLVVVIVLLLMLGVI
jgi:hypothetical protein